MTNGERGKQNQLIVRMAPVLNGEKGLSRSQRREIWRICLEHSEEILGTNPGEEMKMLIGIIRRGRE